MDQVHAIRHKVLVEGLAVRRVAREMGVSRNTVRKYLSQSEPVRKAGPERRSTIVTTNLVFSEWVQVFGDEKLTTALLDRLGHHAHVLTTKGDSYRTRRLKDPDETEMKTTIAAGGGSISRR